MDEYSEDCVCCGHTTQAVLRDFKGDSFENYSLWADYCSECASVRCDAYPGECR